MKLFGRAALAYERGQKTRDLLSTRHDSQGPISVKMTSHWAKIVMAGCVLPRRQPLADAYGSAKIQHTIALVLDKGAYLR